MTIGVLTISLMTIIGASAFLKTTEIQVEGNSMYSSDVIIKASGVMPGDNLIFINAQRISQNIRSTLPFVSAVEVTRSLPNTVHIEITESLAVASVTFAGEIYIIDSAGRVLARVPSDEPVLEGVDFGSLIEVRGVDIEETNVGNILRPVFGTETKLQYMQDVLIALERETLLKDVSFIDVSNIVNVFFGYMGRYRVILGGSTNLRPSNLRHRMSQLESSARQFSAQMPNVSGRISWDDAGNISFTHD